MSRQVKANLDEDILTKLKYHAERNNLTQASAIAVACVVWVQFEDQIEAEEEAQEQEPEAQAPELGTTASRVIDIEPEPAPSIEERLKSLEAQVNEIWDLLPD